MTKKIFTLLKIGRKLATSGVISSISEIYHIPTSIKFIFYFFGLNIKKTNNVKNISPGERLCDALQNMGTTFIKLGQFLATRPDIIGDDLSKHLEKLQDKLPSFEKSKALNILEKELGAENYKKIFNLSDPIAAASIAQVHFATIIDNSVEKKVAIKILRPKIEKLFNEELDAIMLLAYLIQSLIKKTKRLKLVEVVNLLRSIRFSLFPKSFSPRDTRNNHTNTFYTNRT